MASPVPRRRRLHAVGNGQRARNILRLFHERSNTSLVSVRQGVVSAKGKRGKAQRRPRGARW
jgi:hypothetical protein